MSEHSFPLIDKNDHDILMHRNVHFGGSFAVMIDYYEKEGKGAYPDFELSRIQELRRMEDKSHQDLSELFLTDEEKEEVQKAKEKYLYLREVYNSPTKKLTQLIADMILSEDKEAGDEISHVVAQGTIAVPLLQDLLTQDEFYHPLYPGYGHAPAHAATCLGKIGDPSAISSLLQALGRSDFFTEESVLQALVSFGEPAKKHLLKSLVNEPLSKENENAAIALLSFPLDREIATACLTMLYKPQTLDRPTFATYLILGCEGLKNPADQEKFTALSQDKTLSKELTEEMRLIIHTWKNSSKKHRS